MTILELPREERPAAKANGTVNPSFIYIYRVNMCFCTFFLFQQLPERPMMVSLTISADSKCCSKC